MNQSEQEKLEREIYGRLMGSPEYRQALMLVCMNSKGPIWLMGGAVFRLLANIMHGTPLSANHDYDFLVETLEKKFFFREDEGWRLELNHYKNPKFVKSGLSVDVVPLATVDSITRRKLEPTIENFLTGTPFTIQSVVWNCTTRKLMAYAGIRALESKTVAVNNPIQAGFRAERKNITIEQDIRKFADELGYRADL